MKHDVVVSLVDKKVIFVKHDVVVSRQRGYFFVSNFI